MKAADGVISSASITPTVVTTSTSPSPTPVVPGYDIIVIGGQSNAVGVGRGAYVDPYKTDLVDAKIFQVGREMWTLDASGKPLKCSTSVGDENVIVPAGDILQFWDNCWGTGGPIGFGMPFARRWATTHLAPGRKVLLVPAAQGGTSNLQWYDVNVKNTTDNPNPVNLLADLDVKVGLAISQKGPAGEVYSNKIVAFLWSQGESDLMSCIDNPASSLCAYALTGAPVWDQWRDRTAQIFNTNFRAMDANAPILAIKYVPTWTKLATSLDSSGNLVFEDLSSAKAAFQSDLSSVQNQVSFFSSVDTAGLTSNADIGSYSTGNGPLFAFNEAAVHFSAASQVLLADRLMAAYNSVVSAPVATSRAPPSLAAQSPALDFGGMYGYGYANGAQISYVNPATGGTSCPAGYTATQILGTPNLDWPVFFCSQTHTSQSSPIFDFGGVYGYGLNSPTTIIYPNPATGTDSCPLGYTPSQVLGTGGLDNPLYFCYRPHQNNSASALLFGGLYGGGGANGVYANPAAYTGSLPDQAPQCPWGYNSASVFGTANEDYWISLCYQANNYPTGLKFSLISTDPLTDQDCLGAPNTRGAIVHQTYQFKGTLRAHVFYPPGFNVNTSLPVPALAMFHGGGWYYGLPDDWFQTAQFFASRGVIALSFEYILGNSGIDNQVPIDSTKDAVSAIRWMRKYASSLGIDPTQIVTTGDSAGGQLALAVGMVNSSQISDEMGADTVISPRPFGAAPIYPVISVENILALPSGTFAAVSPIDLLTTNTVMPMAIAQGNADTTTPASISTPFCNAANALQPGICTMNIESNCQQTSKAGQVGCDHAFLGTPAGYLDTLSHVDGFLQRVFPTFSFYGGKISVAELLALQPSNQCKAHQ